MRKEKDSLGIVEVPEDKYYGAQTERSRKNFSIGSEKMPIEVIRAFALIKKAAAMANAKLKQLSKKKQQVIQQVCDEILEGKLDAHFPLHVWQTGSGTQTNMNVNEVISNRAIQLMGEKMGSKSPIHPNDDVNKSQSSNDAFPTAMHIAAAKLIKNKLLPELRLLHEIFLKKSDEFQKIIKVGRTHLMDATPLTLGQEFSGYAYQIKTSMEQLQHQWLYLMELAIGGTAVGTGINAPEGYAKEVVSLLSEWTRIPFTPSKNYFQASSSHDAIVVVSSALRQIAMILMKIANDIRWQASGPRCGIGEIQLPMNEPGSSIMPGKINPTQCEALAMIATQVFGNDSAIAFAGSQGHFQLNTFKPVMIHNLLNSVHLLADGMCAFRTKCVAGIFPNKEVIKNNLDRCLMLATILNTELGYDTAAKIVKKADEENISLQESAVALKILTKEKFQRLVDPKTMV